LEQPSLAADEQVGQTRSPRLPAPKQQQQGVTGSQIWWADGHCWISQCKLNIRLQKVRTVRLIALFVQKLIGAKQG